VSIVVDHHHGEEGGRRQLLALHDMRRDLEREAVGDRLVRRRPALAVGAPSVPPARLPPASLFS
jgi:hypothetical protein